MGVQIDKKSKCFLIRTSPVKTAEPNSNEITIDASYMEPFELEAYGNWGGEMAELKRKLNWSVGEAGKFYSHNSRDILWYYYVYYNDKETGEVNKVASRCVGHQVRGDVVVLRSGPEDSNDYPESFTAQELATTAVYYKTNSPSKVFQEREMRRIFGKLGIPQGAAGQTMYMSL